MNTKKPSWNPEWKKDVVYLHVIPRDKAKHIPNLSPFAMKLETWLRINNIKHEVIDFNGTSSKGQSPFLMFNEKEIPDSNFSIEYLSEYFHKDPYPGLSKSEKAVARAFLKMTEENTAWSIFWYRYVEHVDEYATNHMRLSDEEQTTFPPYIIDWITKRAHGHGIGRHSGEEIYKIGCDDIRAISDFLGEKKFMMGESPTLKLKIMDAKKPSWNPEWKKDVVYLHVIPRDKAKHIPNLSPYAIKLETWLRINNIKHEVIDFNGMSSKGQSPFLMFNEKEIPDSNFSIEYLSEYFHKDPYPGLSKSEKAVARAFLKMTEENTAWSISWYRYVEHVDEYTNHMRLPDEEQTTFPPFIIDWITKKAHGHGIGRHSSEEIYTIGCDDIRAISDFLGEKKFMMGESPTLVDCSLFGMLVQIVYVPMNFPMKAVIEKECPNIIQLLERIKDLYWPHWDEQQL